MKTIKTIPLGPDITSKIVRVSDRAARAMVNAGKAIFVPKTEWKKIRTPKTEASK